MRRAGAFLTLILLAASPLRAQTQGQFTQTGALVTGRTAFAEIALPGGDAVAIGGYDVNTTVLASAERYTAKSGTWAQTGAMLAARASFAAVMLTNGKILVTGGAGSAGAVLGAAELYDPGTGTWSPAGTLAVPRYGHAATLLSNGQVLVTGGCTASGCGAPTAVSELYDPKTNSWSLTGSLGTARATPLAVLLNSGAVLAIGGTNDTSCELYDPSTGSWSAAANTSIVRVQSTATRLTDGRVLVTGGASGRYPISSAEIYDPSANAWSPTGAMTAARYGHSATLLADGTVLLAGGYSQPISCGKDCTGYIPTASAEIFAETTGSFASTAPLYRALANQAATETTAGRALIAGGLGYGAYCCQVENNAGLYVPLTLTLSPPSLNFGFLQVGLQSAPQTVTVTNASPHASTFSGIASSGDFAQTNTCPVTLDPGAQCTIGVSFAPTRSGARKGAVTLTDDDPGSPRQTVALTGTGETLALGFSPAALNFGSVTVGSASQLTATLINDGASSVAITGISISPTNKTFTETNTCPAMLAVQQSCVVTVTFTPPDVFAYKATLSVANGVGAAATLPLKGTGADGGGGG